ncbi:hypothetical protein GOV07_04870 [Candidatus Woesearchaeota archaeon]|nr:hypothetical protein [Candidatus Woesearchaeota archaeon]
MPDEDYEELRKRYVEKLRDEFREEESSEVHTRQYEEFRKEYLPKPLSWYEKTCNTMEKILPLSPDAKRGPILEKAIATCHLQLTPKGVTAFSLLVPIILIFIAIVAFLGIPMALGKTGSMFLTFYTAVVCLVLVYPLGRIPEYLASTWRMKSGNQMVLCIFYIVTYMRHTSNLELAIDFAAEHLNPPLSLDMKKIIWNLETEKYDSLKDSLDEYLDGWRDTNAEFIEAMHLIESSLVESSDTRRVEALDKSLSVMLEETYEKMLHYAHNLKSPLTTLHMLGIILPILGLVILPLLVAFMPEVRWYHLAALYNFTLPVLVYFLGRNILSNRPSSYGSADESTPGAENVTVGKMHFTPFIAAFLVIAAFTFVAIIPLLFHAANPDFDFVQGVESEGKSILGFYPVDPWDNEQTEGATFWFNEYRELNYEKSDGSTVTVIAGPYGLIATLLSLLIPLGLGLGVGLYYRLRTRGVIAKRQQAKKLELEFASALFQLGNRLADGLPLEIAFSKVAVVLPDTISGAFFQEVSVNITRLGLSVDDALFHEKYGAINRYPSNIIESSMKVLVESSKKGPLIASQAIINVSNYIKEMHRVEERLKDLMADVISSMTSQIKFLTPTIAGIVIGITSMITTILGKLSKNIEGLEAQGAQNGASGLDGIAGMTGGAVGTYWFQLVVGLYVVELVFVLTILVNGIQNGPDKVNERAMLGRNMVKSTITYCMLAFVVILLFNFVGVSIIP